MVGELGLCSFREPRGDWECGGGHAELVSIRKSLADLIDVDIFLPFISEVVSCLMVTPPIV